MRIAVQRLEKLADRVTKALGSVLGPPTFRETDVRLRRLHGSLNVCSDAVALQQLGVLHQGEGLEQDSKSCYGGYNCSHLLKDSLLPSRRLDLVP